MAMKTGKGTKAGAGKRVADQVEEVVTWLKKTATKATRDGMARYAIPSENAFGVPMGVMQKKAKELGRNHDVAAGLWETRWYEARTMAVFLDEPDRVTPAQMDRWCRGFDNWAICDTACFHLFNRLPHAYSRVDKWARRSREFEKRAGFALMACLALRDKDSGNQPFALWLPLIEEGAADDRNFVKKAVSWALRSVGRRHPDLRASSLELAQRLAASENPATRWVGKDALKDLSRKPAAKSRGAAG
jgi:3-methyladenine DNA glycosylase AlkD